MSGYKKCLWCGKEFYYKNKNRQYCSSACGYDARRARLEARDSRAAKSSYVVACEALRVARMAFLNVAADKEQAEWYRAELVAEELSKVMEFSGVEI